MCVAQLRYSAPGAGPPPWHLFRLTAHTVLDREALGEPREVVPRAIGHGGALAAGPADLEEGPRPDYREVAALS